MTLRSIQWCILITCCITTLARAQEPTQPKLRVLTYNIHHGEGTDGKFDYPRIAKIITDLDPDVVALQEVDRKTDRGGGVDQAAKLGELTGMRHAFGNAMFYSNGQYGEAILSRFPMRDVKDYRLPFRSGQEPRCALAAHIQPDNGLPDFVFIGTHFCHQSSETRTEQAKRINGLFPPAGGAPVILGGDLNARPGSHAMDVLLRERWTDAIAPRSRIDYILHRSCDPWRVLEVTIVDDRVASDHRPVFAVLQWQGGE